MPFSRSRISSMGRVKSRFHSNGSVTDVDASFAENEAHLILSPQVLYEVVSRLQLTDPENSEPLRSDLRNMARICRRLKQRITVRRIPNTCLLEIQVAWRDG